MELTPDTSFASVDENDLTEMYDRFGSQSPPPQMNSLPLQNGFDEVELNLLDQFVQQSTPKKGGRRKNDMCDEGGCEVVEVRCVSVRKELQCLLKLANELEVPSLTHRCMSIIFQNYTYLLSLSLSYMHTLDSVVLGWMKFCLISL